MVAVSLLRFEDDAHRSNFIRFSEWYCVLRLPTQDRYLRKRWIKLTKNERCGQYFFSFTPKQYEDFVERMRENADLHDNRLGLEEKLKSCPPRGFMVPPGKVFFGEQQTILHWNTLKKRAARDT